MTDFLLVRLLVALLLFWLAKVSGDDNSSFVCCVVQRWQLTLVARPFEDNMHCELDTKLHKFRPTFLLFSRTTADISSMGFHSPCIHKHFVAII